MCKRGTQLAVIPRESGRIGLTKRLPRTEKGRFGEICDEIRPTSRLTTPTCRERCDRLTFAAKAEKEKRASSGGKPIIRARPVNFFFFFFAMPVSGT